MVDRSIIAFLVACAWTLPRSTVLLSNLCVAYGDQHCETDTCWLAEFGSRLAEVAYMSEDGEYGASRMPSKPRYDVILRTLGSLLIRPIDYPLLDQHSQSMRELWRVNSTMKVLELAGLFFNYSLNIIN